VISIAYYIVNIEFLEDVKILQLKWPLFLLQAAYSLSYVFYTGAPFLAMVCDITIGYSILLSIYFLLKRN